MDDREIFEDDEVDVPPPELLDHLIDELIEYKAERDEDLEAEWIPEEGLFHVTRAEEDPSTSSWWRSTRISMGVRGRGRGDRIGPLRKDLDLAELLRFSDEELVYGRLALAADEEGTEILVLQAAAPIHQLTASQLDGMIREVAELSRELREEPPSGAA